MINAIKTGIATAIHSAYGDATINTDTVEQGFSKPCFLILCQNTTIKRVSIGRYGQQMDFDIQYHSAAETALEDGHTVAMKLYELLEHIEIPEGIKLRGRDQSHGMVEGILHHKVSYRVLLRDEADEVDTMETIDTTIVKES